MRASKDPDMANHENIFSIEDWGLNSLTQVLAD
jgi:hypothetical protein